MTTPLKTSIKQLKVGILSILFVLFHSSAAMTSELPTVPYVDLDKYLGTWYEIARFPNSFQKGCVAVTAEYSKLPKDRIRVINSCRINSFDGKLSVAKGKAKIADTKTNSKLRVSFFWPFYGDYWIVLLDPQYGWAVVSEPDMDLLWILSRKSTLDPIVLADIKTSLDGLGFDLSRLQMTPQPQ